MVRTLIVKKSGTGVSVDVNQIYVNDYQFIWYSTIHVKVLYIIHSSYHKLIIRSRHTSTSMYLETLVGQAFFDNFKTCLRVWNGYQK